jgi:hypothetical protein
MFGAEAKMNRSQIVSSLGDYNGTLSHSIDKTFDGVSYEYVAKFDSGLDSEEWSDNTGLCGPSDYVNGVFCTWFDSE